MKFEHDLPRECIEAIYNPERRRKQRGARMLLVFAGLAIFLAVLYFSC